MKAASHRALGKYLTRSFLTEATTIQCRAFLYGCIQPDHNPITYIKGSIRSQWFRGHNWGNAQRFVLRLARRLEDRNHLSLWDYYSLGKLIHYTADAFTFAHNSHCDFNMHFHRRYEKDLQSVFLPYIESTAPQTPQFSFSLPRALRDYHAGYVQSPPDLLTDVAYILYTCCMVLSAVKGNCAAIV